MKFAALVAIFFCTAEAIASVVDFNDLDSLSGAFNSPPSVNHSQLADGVGLAGSKGVAYDSSGTGFYASDLRIFNAGLLHPNTLAWRVSIYFKNTNILSMAKPMVGFIGRNPGSVDFTVPESTTPTFYTTVQSNSLYLFASNGTYLSETNILPTYQESSWYHLALEVDYLGTESGVVNNYNLRAILSPSDELGNLGSPIAEALRSVGSVQFQSVADVYPFFGIDTPNYFHWTGPGFSGAMDNFTTSVPEPSCTLLLALAAPVFLAAYRSRPPASTILRM